VRAPVADLLRRWALPLALLLAVPARVLADPALTVLNWPDYLDPDVIEAFEREYGVQLNLVYFETDDDRDALLLETDGRGYDLILVSGAALSAYRRRGWLAPLDAGSLSQLSHLDPRWRAAYEDAETYGVPYLWGTLGIAWRQDLVDAAPLTWMDLFDPGEGLRGRMVMVNTARVSVAMALKALGHSANSTEPDALDAAESLLLAQRPHVKAYGYVDITADSALLTGEVVAAMMYSGDALALADQDPRVAYRVPEEGGELWVDYWTVSAFSNNRALAWAFVDFLSRPEQAARTALTLNYPTPNLSARILLPRAVLDNTAIYPDAATLERSEVLGPLPPRVTRRISEIHQRVLRAGAQETSGSR
jgi:spermidine/putrescine transport system substrate-binding protein